MLHQKITAVLPCYNHEPYLRQRINSILTQTHSVDEIVFLDDASTDQSLSLARQLLAQADVRTTFCPNSSNSCSPFAQWNKGIELASNDLIWIAESDDSCSPALIETLYSRITSDQSVLSFSQSLLIDSSDHPISSVRDYYTIHWPGVFDHDFCMDGQLFIKDYMSRLNAVPNASAVLFRRDAFLRAGKANPRMRFCGDWDAWVRLAGQGRVSFVAQELNFFRCHSQTTRAESPGTQHASEQLYCRFRASVSALGSIADTQSRTLRRTDFLKSAVRAPYAAELKSSVAFALAEIPLGRFIAFTRSYKRLGDDLQPRLYDWIILFILRLAIEFKRRLRLLASSRQP